MQKRTEGKMAWNTVNSDHAIDRASATFLYASLPEKAVKADASGLGLDDVLSIQPQTTFQVIAGDLGGQIVTGAPTSQAARSFRRS